MGKIPTLSPNDTVVIQGVGPLGLFATAVASIHRPRKLIVIGAPDSSLDLAKAWGATDTISINAMPDSQARQRAVLDLTEGRGASITFEFAGAPSAFAESLEFTARGGHIVLVGSAANAPYSTSAHHIVTKQLTVNGCYSATIGHYAQALNFIDRFQGKFDWDLMLGKRYRADEARRGTHSDAHRRRDQTGYCATHGRKRLVGTSILVLRCPLDALAVPQAGLGTGHARRRIPTHVVRRSLSPSLWGKRAMRNQRDGIAQVGGRKILGLEGTAPRSCVLAAKYSSTNDWDAHRQGS